MGTWLNIGGSRLGPPPLWLAVLFLSALGPPLTPQPLTFESLGRHHGLDARIAVSLLIDDHGFLWVGSREGLYRYDGYRATRLEARQDDPGAITDTDIRVLYQDSAGILWVATNTGGLNRFDPESGRFTHFRHDSADPRTISYDSVYGMAEGPEGDLWVGSQIGLNRLDRESGEFVRYLHDAEDQSSLSNDYAYTLLRDRDESLWIATVGGGLNRWNPASESFSRYDLAALTEGPEGRNDVFALAEDAGSTLWIGTRQGLLRLGRDRVAPQLFDLAAGGSSDQPAVTSLRMDRHGQLWIGTIGDGIVRLDPAAGRWQTYRDDREAGDGGLAARLVLDVLVHDDIVFATTWGEGVKLARLPQSGFDLIGLEGGESGLRNATVTTLLADPETPGRPWIGTFGGGPQIADVEARVVHTLPGEVNDLWTEGVLDMARSAAGLLYVATTGGLWELEPDGRARRSFRHDPGDPEGIGEGYVTSLLATGDGPLWVGVGGSGLHRLSPPDDRFTAYRHDPDAASSLSGDYITAIEAEGQGALWVGTRSNGLDLCRILDWSCRRFSADGPSGMRLGHYHVTAIFRDRRGRLWVGTDGGGLHEVLRGADAAVAGFRRWTEADGLVSDGIMAIAEDADGSLWLSTRQGLSRLDPDLGRLVSYVSQSGLPTTSFHARAAGSDSRYLYFGSTEGLLSIPRGRPFQGRDPSPVRITSAEKIGVRPDGSNAVRSPRRLELDYGEAVALEFAVLDYAEVPHEYAFRLDESAEWTALGPRREVTFIDLDPGTYSFEARGRDVFGQWSRARPVEIEVIPPFWRTTWFRLALGLLVVLLALGGHRMRTTTLRRHAREIQRLSERRERALEEALGGEAELAVLTPRQKEVLQLIAEGHSTRDIAERLGVSIKTVETHRANLMERLEIRDVPGLVRLAIRTRLVSPHD